MDGVAVPFGIRDGEGHLAQRMDDDDDRKLGNLTGKPTAEVIPLTPRTIVDARDSLPPDLQPHFDSLVIDYHTAAFGIKWPGAQPNYTVLANLVRAGWRRVI
jgi:hypothetical protein